MLTEKGVGIATPLQDICRFALSSPDEAPVATLENWIQEVYQNTFYDGYIFHGNIYGDTLGRFPDGAWIHTSLVLEEGLPTDLVEGSIIQTRNNKYRLGKEMQIKEFIA